MNKAPWIFLGVLLTLGLSWWGMVYGPALQLGGESADLGGCASLRARVGLARRGEQVYRENGCYYCHPRTATGGEFGYELQLTKLGGDRDLTEDAIGKERMSPVINLAFVIQAKKAEYDANATWTKVNIDANATAKAKTDAQKKLAEAGGSLSTRMSEINSIQFSDAEKITAAGISGVTDGNATEFLGLHAEQLAEAKTAMVSITSGTNQWSEIERMVRLLKTRAGAQFKLKPIAGNWPDVRNGVAPRQSVARDFLFDAHAMPGVMRLGPDLSNVGARLTGADNDAYAHLYDPQSTGKSSHMPPFRYLFKSVELKLDEALPGGAFLVEKKEGDKVIERIAVTPTAKARALLAFLKSLRTDRALPEAPLVETQSAAQE